MGETKLTFKRYEKKYLLSAEQYQALWQRLESYIEPDDYFSSTVCSIYYDDDDYTLIRHSIDKPVYKEKLRLRSYNVPKADGEAFVELKKKFKCVFYKRRIVMPYDEAMGYLTRGEKAKNESQISREIDYFLKFYNPKPATMVCYDRLAYFGIEDPEFRVTFDLNVRCRNDELDLALGDRGERIIPPDYAIMEIKTKGAMPLWLCDLLSSNKIYPTSFSKYGTYYKMTSQNPKEFFEEHHAVAR